MRRPPDPQLLGFLEAYDRLIADLALALREIILEEVHDASESIVDLSGLHRCDLVRLQRKDEGHVLLHRHQCAHVNLGFPRGSTLREPNRVLEGDGKTMRHIKFASQRDPDRSFVRRYIHASIEQLGAAAGDVSQADFKSSPVWAWGGQANAMQSKNNVAPIRCGVYCGVESTYGN